MIRNFKAEILIEALKKAPKGLVVEIGCIRNPEYDPEDGWSTLFLAQYCQQNNIEFRSYDNEQKHVGTANSILRNNGLEECVQLVDGAEALHNLGPISLLFLDSHKDPMHSFVQLRHAELAPEAILIVDDAHEIENWKHGKATLIKHWLDEHNMDYQIKDTFTNPYTNMTYKILIAQFPEGKESI